MITFPVDLIINLALSSPSWVQVAESDEDHVSQLNLANLMIKTPKGLVVELVISIQLVTSLKFEF